MSKSGADTAQVKVLFVCLGNICRSPAAEAVMLRLIEERGLQGRVEVDSAGIYGGHAGDLPDHRMRVHARRRGYELTHRSRRVTSDDFDRFDMIVAMDAANYSDLRRMAPTAEQERKVVHIGRFIRQYPHYDHVPDPYYEGSQGFELALDLLEDACDALLSHIISKNMPHTP